MSGRGRSVLNRSTLLLALSLAASAPALCQPALYRPGDLRSSPQLEQELIPPPQGANPSRWQIAEGVALYHFEIGSGPPVLFVHGGPGLPPAEADPGHRLVGAARTVIFYHQRGSGRSTRPFESFAEAGFAESSKRLVEILGLRQQLADIERIRRLLELPRLDLIGHSYGGFLAALYAAELPERVASLTLVSPAETLVMPHPRGGLYAELQRQLPEGDLKQEYGAYLGRFFGTFATLFTKSESELAALNSELGPYFAAVLEKRGLKTDSLAIAPGHDSGFMPFGVYFSLGMTYDLTSALEQVECPVLLLSGELDPVATPEGLATYTDHLPDVRTLVVPGAGHHVHYDQPERYAQAVLGFLSTRPQADVR